MNTLLTCTCAKNCLDIFSRIMYMHMYNVIYAVGGGVLVRGKGEGESEGREG